MKKFNFSLQKVLEIKEQILENFKIELSNLNHEYSEIEISILILKDKFLAINNEFLEKSEMSVSVGEMIYYKMYMDRLLKNIETKEVEKVNLMKVIEAKRQEIINMNMEISTLEKLKEKEIEKYNKAVEKKEEIFIEEFVVSRKLSKKFAL